MRGTGRGRCKVVMWCDRTRPVGCTTGCTAVLQLYESTVDSPPAHPAAVPLYSCTRAPSAEPQLCTAVRGQKQSSFASWSFIASAMPRTVQAHDVGGNPQSRRSRIFRASRTHGCRLAKATPASTHERNECGHLNDLGAIVASI